MLWLVRKQKVYAALAGGLRQPNFRLHPPAQTPHRRVTRMKEVAPSAQVPARSRTRTLQRNHGAVGEPRRTAGRHGREVFRPTFLFDLFVQSVLRARACARRCRVGQPGRVPPSSASLWHGVEHLAAGLVTECTLSTSAEALLDGTSESRSCAKFHLTLEVVTSPPLLGFWSHNAGAILNRENASTRGPGEAQRTLTSGMQAAVMLPFGLSQEQVSALVLVVSRPAARMVTHVCRTRVPAWQGAGGPQGGTAELPGMYGGAQMAPMRTIAGRLGGVADSGDGQPLQNVSVHQYYEKQQPPMQYAEYPPQQHVMTTGWVPCDVLPNKMSTVHDVWSGANFCEEVAEMLRAHAASKYFSQGVTEPKPHMMGGKLRVR